MEINKIFIDKVTSSAPPSTPVFHSHDYYELYLLFEGNRQIYITETLYEMKKNDILLIPPNTPHKNETGTFTRYLVCFHENNIAKEQLHLIKRFLQQKISMSNIESKKIFDIVETMYQLYINFPINGEEINVYNVNVLFQYLLFSISRLNNFPISLYVSNRHLTPLTQKVIEYIKKHYSEKISLASLCKTFYVSPSTLYKRFKKDTNMPVIDFLLLQRLHISKNLLCYSKKSITEISYLCGFSSQQYFYLMFNKHIGMPPSQYRKENQIKH